MTVVVVAATLGLKTRTVLMFKPAKVRARFSGLISRTRASFAAATSNVKGRNTAKVAKARIMSSFPSQFYTQLSRLFPAIFEAENRGAEVYAFVCILQGGKREIIRCLLFTTDGRVLLFLNTYIISQYNGKLLLLLMSLINNKYQTDVEIRTTFSVYPLIQLFRIS